MVDENQTRLKTWTEIRSGLTEKVIFIKTDQKVNKMLT